MRHRVAALARSIGRSGIGREAACYALAMNTTDRLLALLAKHAGKVLTQRFLLKEVWGPAYVERAHYLRIYMGRLRRKLEDDAAQPRHLLTETAVGYRLLVDGQGPAS